MGTELAPNKRDQDYHQSSLFPSPFSMEGWTPYSHSTYILWCRLREMRPMSTSIVRAGAERRARAAKYSGCQGTVAEVPTAYIHCNPHSETRKKRSSTEVNISQQEVFPPTRFRCLAGPDRETETRTFTYILTAIQAREAHNGAHDVQAFHQLQCFLWADHNQPCRFDGVRTWIVPMFCNHCTTRQHEQSPIT